MDPNAGRRVEWRVPLDGEALGAAAIDNTTNTAYIGTTAGTLYAIDISAGDLNERVKWTFSAEGSIPGPVLIHEGAVYFGDLSSRFYRLNPRTQTTDWVFEAGAWVWAQAVPDDQNGAIYVSTLGGHIHALNISTGAPIWGQRIEGQIVGTPLPLQPSSQRIFSTGFGGAFRRGRGTRFERHRWRNSRNFPHGQRRQIVAGFHQRFHLRAHARRGIEVVFTR